MVRSLQPEFWTPKSVLETDLLILHEQHFSSKATTHHFKITYFRKTSLHKCICFDFFWRAQADFCSLVSSAGLWAPKPSDLLFHFAGHGHQLHPVAGLSGLVMKCTRKNRERCLNRDSGKPQKIRRIIFQSPFFFRENKRSPKWHGTSLQTSPNGLTHGCFNFDRGTKAMCRGWKANESAPSVRQAEADLFFTHKRAARCRGLPIFWGYFILGCGSQVQEIGQEISELSLDFPCNFPAFFLPWPGATAWSRASCCGWPLDVTGGFKSLRCWIFWSLYRILGIIKQP